MFFGDKSDGLTIFKLYVMCFAFYLVGLVILKYIPK